MQEKQFNPWVGKVPWRRAWQPTLIFLPEKSHRQRILAGYSPCGCKESDTTQQQSTPTHEASESAPLQIASKAIPPVQLQAAPATGISPGAPWDLTPRELWCLDPATGSMSIWGWTSGRRKQGSPWGVFSESLWTGTEVWRGTGQDGEFQLS